MIEKANFKTLVEKALTLPGRKAIRPVIEKELLHYDILFSLDKENLLEKLTFQGGTSLRLCYGSSRFSEDLDFAGGRDFCSTNLNTIKSCIEHYIGHRYDLKVTVKQPKEMKEDPKYDGLKVDKWQVAIVTSPERKGLPQQKIKIEIMNIPAYSSEPHTLLHNYDFLPDGYSDTLIMTESLDEIMTDKLIAFVNCDRYIRYRDIWDLRWLIQKGAQLNIQWFNQKISDYQISDYETKLSNKIESISTIIYSDQFKHEMQRFIPYDTQQRTLQKDKFYSFLTNEITTLLTTVQQTFLSAPDDSEFLM